MYQKANEDLWVGRLDSSTDESQFRHFQTVHFDQIPNGNDIEKKGVGLLGYAVDAGVALNKGRIGARNGPDVIKRALAGLPNLSGCHLVDYGNIYHDADALIDTQREFAGYAARVMQQHKHTFLLGGGHDIAYAQYLATRQLYPDAKIGVINIDAHFDTRKAPSSTSGTSFRQILESDDAVGYFVLGVQQSGNTQNLFDYAEQTGTQYVFADELYHYIAPPIKDKLDRFIHDHDVVLFTLCMDAIDSAYAPGVSAPATLGLSSHIVLELAKRIIASGKVDAMSIAEMNPEYDIDGRTAKLIANMMQHIIH